MRIKSVLTTPTDESLSTQKALVHVKMLLNQLQAGGRLPPVRVLIKQAGVSPRYMCRALSLMAGEKTITIIKGKGVFAGSIARPAIIVPKMKWERIMEQVTRDIFDKTFGAGMLPPINRLCRHYGVSSELIKKAINGLLDQNLIVDDRNGYRIRLPGVTSSFSSMLFITPGLADSGKAVIYNERLRQVHIRLENECNIHGLRFAQRSFSGTESWSAGCLGDPESHIGYIIWSHGLNPHLLKSILHDISRRKRPIAIIDEMGDWQPPVDLPSHLPLRIFAIAGFTAGIMAARFLLSLGHRKVAFLSLFENQFWSRERHRGLCTQFQLTGIHDGVIAETVGQMPEYDRETQYPFGPMGLSTSTEIDRLPQVYHRHYGSQFWNIASYYNLMNDTTYFSEALEPLFRRMLEAKGVTAWVAANTMLGTTALLFLENHGIGVPTQISLFGFDNAPEAYQDNLSGYDFNFAGLAGAAFSYIIHPSNRLFTKANNRSEFEGLIIRRGSTGRL